MKGFDRGRRTRSIGPVLDKINIILAMGIVAAAVFLIIDRNRYELAFPILFTLSALMNFVLGFKHYKMADMGRMMVLMIAFVVMAVLSVIGYIAVLN